ncbi:MAG TPA: methyltransferase domain-containing protein [Ktedonobacteraceae bacterium]
MLISEMGGVWPEQSPPIGYRRVLDVSCGSGYRLVQAAQAYPTIQKLYGVDTNERLLMRARQLAGEQHVAERVEFQLMDALNMLEFPFDYLDLVNIQMGGYFFRTWEWSKLLREFRRVTRPGGIIRAVEQDFISESTSSAFNALMQLIVQTYSQAGHLFVAEHDSLLREMPRLFKQFGVRNVQTRCYTLEFRADTPDWQDFARHILLVMAPFVAKWGRLPENYEALCQRAIDEIARPDFVAQQKIMVIWGQK